MSLLVLLVLAAVVAFPTAHRQAGVFYPFRRAYLTTSLLTCTLVTLVWLVVSGFYNPILILALALGIFLIWQDWKLMFLSKQLEETIANTKLEIDKADRLLYDIRKAISEVSQSVQ